jgi:hypothetical protein
MPRATDNRKPVGTGTCEKCGENTAEFFQVQRGKRLGYLYRKCINHRANQCQTPAQQFEWLDGMKRTVYPMIPHPLQAPAAQPVEPAADHVPEPEPKAVPEKKPAPVPNRGGFIGFAAMAGAVALALFT